MNITDCIHSYCKQITYNIGPDSWDGHKGYQGYCTVKAKDRGKLVNDLAIVEHIHGINGVLQP